MRCFLTAVNRQLGRVNSRFHQETARLTAVPYFWRVGVTGDEYFDSALSFGRIVRSGLVASLIGVSLVITKCAPSKDTVLSDVERNYTGTGFLDTDTFQVICPLPAVSEDRLGFCRQKLITELVQYKERYNREASAQRMHQDFLPFFKPAEVTEAEREEWRRFYHVLAEGRTRLVLEKATADGFEGVYRLRFKDLIYRVQKAK